MAMTRREKRALNRKRWRSVSTRRKRNAADYRKFKRARARTYGPVPFETQPGWVRRRGRKGKALLRKGSSTSRKSARRSRRSYKTRLGFSSDYALGRAYGIRAPKGMRKRAARRYVGKQGMRRARKAAGQVLTYNQLMKALSGTRLKAWVCAGPKRTGCGGGRKRYGGSRQIGVLRP